MPFVQQTPRPFTRAEITGLPADQQGVYGLFRPQRWIYVGRGNIRERLLAHLNGDNPCITREKPSHFVREVTSRSQSRERALILELDPICNRRVG